MAITRPTSGDYVSSSSTKPVLIEGTVYGTIPKGYDIWIVHSPAKSERWYPDGSIVGNIALNAWKQQVYLVDPVGTEYDIMAVLVDNETSKKYRNILETKAYKGFPASEGGAPSIHVIKGSE